MSDWCQVGHDRLAPSSDLAEAVAFIEATPDPDGALVRHRTRILDLINGRADAADRHARPGHLTGSAFVVDPDRNQFVLLFHAKLRRWLQPGGHADGDMNLAAVALREATEETGLDGLLVDPLPVDLDVHLVSPPAEDTHLHLDVRFLVTAPAGATLVGNHESSGLEWCDWTRLDGPDIDAGLRRLGLAARARLLEPGW